MNIAFLFGAGVSIPSEMDNTLELTEKILNGENIIRGTQGEYGIKNMNSTFFDKTNYEYVNRIKKLFFVLQNNLGGHYSFTNKIMNYEDYYYMIDSMHTDENMEYENPIVTFFTDYLFKVHTYLFEPIDEFYAPLRIIDLMGEAKNYIKDLIALYLSKPAKNLEQFNFISNINIDKDYSKVFVFTLNHDTLIEQYFFKNNISFSDGFIDNKSNARFWDPNSFKEKINLLKLHGSINWRNYDTDDSYEKEVCIYNKSQRDFFHPIINIGSFNKLNEYSKGINFDLQCLLKNYLNSCNRLIISGYSFRDKGINSRIINWLFGNRNRKIIIVHKNGEELFQNARPAIFSLWEEDKKSNTKLIRIIPKWIQETNWAEIKSII